MINQLVNAPEVVKLFATLSSTVPFRTEEEVYTGESMHSKRTRLAYLKRMLVRLQGEETRIRQLVSSGELLPKGGELAVQQARKSREELLAEQQILGAEEAGS